jgi:quercetin dioxygenase-like cupin family protein
MQNYYNWADIAYTPMNEKVGRQQINADRLSLLRITLEQGGVVAIHQHPNEQISVLISGKVEFNVDGNKRVLTPGDIVVVPENLPHGVEALEASIIVEAFNPPRYDLMPKA